MPFVHVELFEGRTTDQKEKMAEEIIESIHKHGNVDKAGIHVIFQEMAGEDYYTGENK